MCEKLTIFPYGEYIVRIGGSLPPIQSRSRSMVGLLCQNSNEVTLSVE